MKKIFLIIISFALLHTGCENIDFGDKNKNVNGPADANTASLLSGAMTRFATRTGRPYRITPSIYVQYFMQFVYNDEMLYANSPGYWADYYSQALSNLQVIIDICSDPEKSKGTLVMANGDPKNQLAVALIYKSVIFKRVTDLFGNVPYSEALSIESLTPAYDAQENIYAGMIADVKAARDMIDTDKPGVSGDAVYDGDMEMWQKFANSFLMSLALQLSESESSVVDPEAVFTEALGNDAGCLEDPTEDAIYTFDVDNDFKNPWNWMRPADYGISQEVVSSLKGEGANKVTSNTTFDERLLFIASDTSDVGEPYGYEDYDAEDTPYGENSQVNSVLLAADTKLPLMTSAYVYLNRAEAAARGWTTEDVDEMLQAGIMASYTSFASLYYEANVSITDGSAYAAARVADISTAPGGALQVIGEEKWVALFPLGYDAWSEWRRTDYPDLKPAPDAINDGNIPRRYNYPNDESTLNAAGYKSGVSGLAPADDKNTARVWWDK